MNPRLALVLIVLSAFAIGQTFDEFRTKQSKDLVPKLEQLADWCRQQKLFGSCIDVYIKLLIIDPEHEKARQFLRYTKKDGQWHQSASFKPPKNLSGEKLPEYKKKLAEIVGGYSKLMVDTIERAKGELDAATRAKLLREVLDIDPENEAARLIYARAVKDGGGDPNDPVIARARRDELELGAKAAVEAMPEPKAAEPTKIETELGITWTGMFKMPNVRLFGTGDSTEARDAARWCEAAGPMFKRAFNQQAPFRDHFTIYLLANEGEKDKLLKNHPKLNDDQRAFFAKTGGAWVQWNHYGDWSPLRDRRMDGAVRQTFGTMLFDAFKVDMHRGWASEGFGFYLTYLVTGTRLTWLVRSSGYGTPGEGDLRVRLLTSGVDWLGEGLSQINAKKKPDLRSLWGKDVNSMDDQDVLYAFVLANFLLQTRPIETPALLRLVGAGKSADEALKEALNLDVAGFEAAVLTWLKSVVS